MSPESVIALVLSGCMLIVSFVNSIVNGARASKKDTMESETRLNEINQSLLKVNLKLDQVCQTTVEIRTDVRTMQNKQIEHTEQIARLEQSVATAFIRIDELREQIKGLTRD